jgi:hypothetical protein
MKGELRWRGLNSAVFLFLATIIVKEGAVCGSATWYTVQLALVQRFYQLYFLIYYCCDNTRKVRAPNAVRRSGAPHMYWPHKK